MIAMKPMLLSLITVFLSIARAYPQFQPMAVEGAHWTVFALTDDGPDHHAFLVKGDTTIGTTSYKKVYRRKVNSYATALSEFLPPYSFSNEKLIGAIRDDLSEKTVYGIGFVTNAWFLDTCEVMQEQLLHDFSASIGEEISGCLHTAYGLPNAVVDSIETVLLFGEERTVLFTSYGELIEGIGTWLGPFIPVYSLPVPGNPTLLIDYCVGSDDDCGFIFTAISERQFESVASLFPNPASSEIKLVFREILPADCKITIRSRDGQVMKSLSTELISETLVMDISTLPPGIYFLNVETPIFWSVRKIIVQ
ncbi:MAG: T9SS C-terminal target domain-containing protein [Bacteroidetes bacterium]|nr:MAG: T9SS C-terminal target domain-containing protein [Bacteroidota bacterium]